MTYQILPFDNLKHRARVIALWRDVFGYEADHNAPGLVIDKKMEHNDALFFVATSNQDVIATVMAGYDGHRGWIYSLAVLPYYQKQGLGSKMLSFVEEKLLQLGCMKINLQILEHNKAVENFYVANGYQTEKRVSMGKRLSPNIRSVESIYSNDPAANGK
ncbi:MAG: GNAT family acetyltransferase [Desulfobacteraceae bacterium]|nr:GNAT family acetyltransferase [Desulfobacteraceae bacterium]